MTIPTGIRQDVEERVAAFCVRRVPPLMRDEMRFEYGVRGNAITILERRPPWRADFGPEWSSMKVAQLRFEPKSATWTLWWSDRNERWHRHEGVEEVRDVDELLETIDQDSTSIFWG